MARRSTPQRSRTLPVSGASVAVDGEKTGGNWVEETFNKDMTKDEMTFLHTENREAQREKVRVCSYRVAGSPWAPSVSQNSEWLPFGLFSQGMGAFGKSGCSKFRRGSQISSSFLGLSPPFGSQTTKCEHSKNLINHGVD